MANLIFVGLITTGALAWASVFEWNLHRFVMHRPVWHLRRPFERHALVHHHIFKADESYHLSREEDKHTIPMAWWHGPVLIAIEMLPSIVLSFYLGLQVLVISGIVSVIYFSAYEYMHWCMHLPKSQRRLIEQLWIFRLLNGHHLMHHRYQNKNFNVVLPLADWLFGTLLRRSPTPFMQPRGHSVPDVQPV